MLVRMVLTPSSGRVARVILRVRSLTSWSELDTVHLGLNARLTGELDFNARGSFARRLGRHGEVGRGWDGGGREARWMGGQGGFKSIFHFAFQGYLMA